VILNVQKLKTARPILNAGVDNKKLLVLGGIYKLASGTVDLLV
jgi:carbonic anhydrase